MASRSFSVKRKSRVALLVLMALAIAAVLFGATAGATPVPPELRASLLLRTLAYDRNLSSRANDAQITILVVEGSERGDTEAMAAALESATARVSVAGLPVRVVRQRFASVEQTVGLITRESVTVLYLGSGLHAHAPELSAAAAAQRATLVSADGADMPNGCALGFTVDGNRPVIVVDLDQAIAAGMDLDPSVLQVARVL